MNGRLKRKLMIGVAAIAVLLGGIVAIVSASGSSRGPSSAHVSRARGVGTRTSAIAVSANYLGVTRAVLRRDLRSGATLAEVASATPGRSVSGLIDALFTASSARLSAQAAAGKLSQAKRSARLANLRERLHTEVYRPHGAGAPVASIATAASYLGIPRRQIRSEQRAGRSLAQIAAGRPGKSADGLIAALLAAQQATLAASAAAGTLSHAQEQKLLASLRRRVSTVVDRAPHGQRG